MRDFGQLRGLIECLTYCKYLLHTCVVTIRLKCRPIVYSSLFQLHFFSAGHVIAVIGIPPDQHSAQTGVRHSGPLQAVCPGFSGLHDAVTRQQFSGNALRPRTAVSFKNRSQHDDFQRDVVRPTDMLPTVSTTKAKTETGLPQRQFVLHRCPASYDLKDPQDEWFRTAVAQRSPPTKQVTFTEEILIVTPICNSEKHLRRYFENLCSLAYPHRLISVVLGEDSSTDKTVQVNSLDNLCKKLPF